MTRSTCKEDQPGGCATGAADEAHRAWATLVPQVIHPAKVAAIEAIRWIERPLSSNELVTLFDSEDFYLGLVSYHVRQLTRFGVLSRVKSRQRRGAIEKFYYFTDRT